MQLYPLGHGAGVLGGKQHAESVIAPHESAVNVQGPPVVGQLYL